MDTNKFFTLFSVAVAIILTTGCAPMISGAMNASITDEKVIEKTAAYFGVDRSKIVISSIDKGMLATEYKVRHGGQLYNCAIYYGEVNCKKPGG